MLNHWTIGEAPGMALDVTELAGCQLRYWVAGLQAPHPTGWCKLLHMVLGFWEQKVSECE